MSKIGHPPPRQKWVPVKELSRCCLYLRVSLLRHQFEYPQNHATDTGIHNSLRYAFWQVFSNYCNREFRHNAGMAC